VDPRTAGGLGGLEGRWQRCQASQARASECVFSRKRARPLIRGPVASDSRASGFWRVWRSHGRQRRTPPLSDGRPRRYSSNPSLSALGRILTSRPHQSPRCAAAALRCFCSAFALLYSCSTHALLCPCSALLRLLLTAGPNASLIVPAHGGSAATIYPGLIALYWLQQGHGVPCTPWATLDSKPLLFTRLPSLSLRNPGHRCLRAIHPAARPFGGPRTRQHASLTIGTCSRPPG
jgi:hypothetical protein